MGEMDALAEQLEGPPGSEWATTGSWSTEEASAAALDNRLEAIGLFHIYREIAGTLTQPRPGQRERTLRIDRVLTPTAELRNRGWSHGAIGIEVKHSGLSIGPPLAQAMDYVRGTWQINGVWFQLNAAFLWPMDKQSGPLASLMVHNRIGSASFDRYDMFKLSLGEEVIFANNSITGIRIPNRVPSGRRVGSR